MVEGRTYRYNERTGVWKNFSIRCDDDGNIFVTAMEGGGKGDRKTITLKLTPAEAAYFAIVLKRAAAKCVELGLDASGRKPSNGGDDF